jgi:hypothetical protein
MRRLWLQLFTILSLNSALLSGCPMQSPDTPATEHGSGGGY